MRASYSGRACLPHRARARTDGRPLQDRAHVQHRAANRVAGKRANNAGDDKTAWGRDSTGNSGRALPARLECASSFKKYSSPINVKAVERTTHHHIDLSQRRYPAPAPIDHPSTLPPCALPRRFSLLSSSLLSVLLMVGHHMLPYLHGLGLADPVTSVLRLKVRLCVDRTDRTRDDEHNMT